MRKPRRRVTLLSIAGLLSLYHGNAGAYIIEIVAPPEIWGENIRLTTTANRISVSDFFDQYSESRWVIDSVEQAPSGGWWVHYRYPVYGPWDSYGARADFGFRILSESGDLTPEPVMVDVWGSSFYDFELFGSTCCYADGPPSVSLYGGAPGAAEERRWQGPWAGYGVFADSFSLLSNTTYFFSYYNSQYVEGTPQGSWPPLHFRTWEEYEAFVAEYGTSGYVYASSFGIMDFNLALHPTSVPEPGALALFGVGLAGLLFGLRRRREPLSN